MNGAGSDIPVFAAEQEAGLADVVRATSSVAYAAVARPDMTPVSDAVLVALRATAGDLSLPDLFPLTFVLATTGGNLNDDWFVPERTYAARHTPADKPFNHEHASGDIIGHMTAGRVMTLDGKPVADDAPCPNEFHAVGTAFLYRHFADDEPKQKRADEYLASIAESVAEGDTASEASWFVSMECRFRVFDYVLVPTGRVAVGSTAHAKLVPRADDSAFLTKHLRAYGGTGTYQDYRVFRAFRDITFSGVGLVKQPANPNSVILGTASADGAGTTPAKNPNSNTTFSPSTTVAVYSPPSTSLPETETAMEKETESKLKADIEMMRSMLDEKSKKLVEVEKLLGETTKANWDKQVADLTAELATVKATLAAKTAELVAVTEKVTASETSRQEMQVRAEAAEQKLADAGKAAKLADRTAKVKAAYKLDSDDAAKAAAEALIALADEAFAAHIELISKVTPAAKVETPVAKPPKVDPAAALAAVTPVNEPPLVVPAPDAAAQAQARQDALAKEMEGMFPGGFGTSQHTTARRAQAAKR